MEQKGYAYRKTNHRFLSAFPHGKYEFSLALDGRGGLVGVSAGFFVHFEALEKQFKKALGYACPWSAGATLLNAGANPWNYFLNEDRFAAMSPEERAGLPSDVIHPQERVQACVQFLLDAHAQYAVPLFQKLQDFRQLADFYREYIQSGCSGRCRPLAENVIYLWLLVAASLGDNLDEIAASAKGMKSAYVGHDVDSKVQTVRKHIEANDLKTLLS
jgi:hypothetical protein